MGALTSLFEKLELKPENGLVLLDKDNRIDGLAIPSRIKRILHDVIKPQAFFCFGNRPILLFFENVEDKSLLHKQIWNLNEAPIVFIVDSGNVEIFNGFNFIKNEGLSSLHKFGGAESLSDFSYFELVSGKCWEKYHSELSYKNRVDYQLLNNIKSTRTTLHNEYGLAFHIANALVGKVIFIRYLIDRNVNLEVSDYMETWDNEGFCTLLSDVSKTKSFFDYLATKFNGDEIFELSEADYECLSLDILSVIVRLLKSEEISSGQLSLFDLYDFSIIPVEFISNIYEQFIGQEDQEKNGAYYTPQFLVDFILNETLVKDIDDTDQESCKILDPACGSGIFLVESLRRIIEKRKPDWDKETLKKLAINSIYGVDKDRNAIQVAVFSVYLTLLDYQSPADIENFTFPKLIDCNFFQADIFNLEHSFNQVLGSIQFDFIVGNPPWKRGKGGEKETSLNRYVAQRKEKEKGSLVLPKIGGEQISQGFVLRVADFATEKTKCALIINSKTLYNSKSKDFRLYFLTNNYLQKVFELAPVRREVFDSEDTAIAPGVVLFFSNAFKKDASSQIVEHVSVKKSRLFSLFKIFAIYRNDIKQVKQALLIENDWLWKTLVYGTYLDFNFIKRLKEQYKTINNEIIENKVEFISGQGVTVRGKGKNRIPKSTVEYIGKPYINAKKDVAPFWINSNPIDVWEYKNALYPRNPQLFIAPVLLVCGGANKFFENKLAFMRSDAIYNDSFVGVKNISPQNGDRLYDVAAILSSNLFPYYGLHTFSYLGIERENTNDDEKWSLPFVSKNSLKKSIKNIEQIFGQKHENDKLFKSEDIDNELAKEHEYLNEIVAEELSFSEVEKTLIEYANKVVIPMQMEHKGWEKLILPIKAHDSYLEDYAHIYIDRFEKLFSQIGQRFYVQISCTPHIVAMYFCVSKDIDINQIIWNDIDDKGLLTVATRLSSENVSESLFIQKDIRGFENDMFYIIKPNEKRIWHKAVGYVDVEEFMDAILKSGRRV
jgi:hypothetical protein